MSEQVDKTYPVELTSLESLPSLQNHLESATTTLQPPPVAAVASLPTQPQPFQHAFPTHDQQPPGPALLQTITATDPIRLELLKQFEYYFSAKNLLTDTYLLSQMDQDAFVPVGLILQFKRIKQLTSDLELVLNIIRKSSQLQLDITGTKVRSIGGHQGGLITITTKKLNKPYLIAAEPASQQKTENVTTAAVANGNQQQQHQRCVLIMREVASTATLADISELFVDKEPKCPPAEKCEAAGNDSWYITFANEDDSQRALQYLKADVQTFMDKPIRARIKTHSHAAVAATVPRSPNTSAASGTNSIYPVINRVISDSPSSFLSPASSPQLTELNVNAYVSPQQQQFGMSPSGYKTFVLPENGVQQHMAVPQYWQVGQQQPKMNTFYTNPPIVVSPTESLPKDITEGKPGSPKPVPTKQDDQQQQLDTTKSQTDGFPQQAMIYPYPGQQPANLVQMHIGTSGGFNSHSAQAVAQAAAMQAYYHSLSQSPSQQPSVQSFSQNASQLLSSSSTSSLNATPVGNNGYVSQQQQQPAAPLINNNPQYMLHQAQFSGQGYYIASGAGGGIGSNGSTPNSKDMQSATGGKQLPMPTTPTSTTGDKQISNNNSSVFNNSSPYLIANMNNLSMGTNPNGVSAAAINAAYQYYHAYNTAMNPGYQQQTNSMSSNTQTFPPNGQFYEIPQQTQTSESQTSTAETSKPFNTEAPPPATNPTPHMVYNTGHGYSGQFANSQMNNNNNNNNAGSGSPQLLVSTLNGQPGQPTQYQMNNSMSNSFNHTPPPATTSVQQHFTGNGQRNNRGNNNTTSLTETRYHHNSYQFNGNNNRNNSYFNRKFNNSHNLNDSNGNNSGMLSPGQPHYYYNYNQYSQGGATNSHSSNPYFYNAGHNNKGGLNTSYAGYNHAAGSQNSGNGANLGASSSERNSIQMNSHRGGGDESVKNNEEKSESGFLKIEESGNKTKSPPINCDLVSFPPLLNAQPVTSEGGSSVAAAAVNASIEESGGVMPAQMDPAIISISNSAGSIPTAPTIVTSNPVNSNGQVKISGKKQANLNKMLQAATNESLENPNLNSSNTQHTQSPQSHPHAKQQYTENVKGSQSLHRIVHLPSDHYSNQAQQKHHNNYSNHQQGSSNSPHNNHYKSGTGYARKSIDSLHLTNSNTSHQRGNNNHQNQKFHQQNPRNYGNSRQHNQNNNTNSPNHSNSLNTSTDNTSSGSISQTGSPSSNSSMRNNKKSHSALSYSNSAISNASKNTADTANSDDEQITQNGACWGNNKKLTFAEILQKKGSAASTINQQDSSVSISSNSPNVSSASSQATTPTTTHPTKSFPLVAPIGGLYPETAGFETKLIESDMLMQSNNNATIPV